MGSSEMLENGSMRNGNSLKPRGEGDLEGITTYGSEEMVNRGKKNVNLGEEILEDFDSYCEVINDRLMVSRMVSDSVIKGMVSAVEQEAAERLVAKEMELAKLKEHLQFHGGGLSKTESFGSQNELESTTLPTHMSLSDVFKEHDKTGDILYGLRSSVKDQFEKLMKSISEVRGSNSIKSISCAHSELVGLEGIPQKKDSESWVQVDERLNKLKVMVDTVFTRMGHMLQLSKTSLGQWQEEHLAEVDLEAIVMRSVIRTVQEDSEYTLWNQLCGDQIEKLKEISGLRKDLDVVLKSLSSSETGHMTSHDANVLTRKASNEHATSGKMGDNIPENLDAATLKHMSREELVNHFNTIMTKMKRHHESILQKKTDEYFALRAEYLNLRGGSHVPHKRDMGELDILRKKIPQVIFKLDDILVKIEKHPSFIQETLSFYNLKDRGDNLLSENDQLRSLLKDREKEIKSLSSQVSQHSLVEADMLKQIGDLNLAMEESQMESSLRDQVYSCFLRDLSGETSDEIEGSSLEFDIINDESSRKFEIEDSEIESLLMQEIWGVIFSEGIKKVKDMLYLDYLNEKEIRISLETKVIQMEYELKFEVEEKDRVKQIASELEMYVSEKEKLATDALAAREKVCQELNFVKEFASHQQTLVSRSNKEVTIVKGQLAEALKQTEVLSEKAAQLNKSLEEKGEELKEANHRTNMLLSISEAKEIELRNQVAEIIGSVVSELQKMLAEFEDRVMANLRTNNARFEHVSSQLNSLVKKANLLRTTMLMYQQKLEGRCSDLQLAEAEVDLLGDEVDTLLSILEKIYIALDHYSPVLQHYPGITEILKMIRRELTGESTKVARPD